MTAKRASADEYLQRRTREAWRSVARYRDFHGFANFMRYTGSEARALFGPYAMQQVAKFYPEVERVIGPTAAYQGPVTIDLDEGEQQFFVSVLLEAEQYVLTWSCAKVDPDAGHPPAVLDGAGCLVRLGHLAQGARQAVHLRLPEQADKAFMWKAPSFHPLQVLENVYQRVVRKAGHDAESDQVQAQSDALSRYFIQDPGSPELFRYKPLETVDGAHLAAVKMNHLIDSFYLFRLLINYRVEADEVTEDLRAELSGDLTKLLHNGDKTRMRWLSDWLTRKIGQLGAAVNALNQGGQQRAIFFLKGGRALNYFLGTPEKGENDWDTQVVINPNLSPEEWYRCLADVHDAMLTALKTFKTEFTQLVEDNAPQFSEYLAAFPLPQTVEDEEDDAHEALDANSLKEHANCKAELIDIGLPRRDSASALEEWTRLSAQGTLLESQGIIYPHREYYLNEYLMMVRDAFTSDEIRKAPKRITRLGLILQNDRGREAPSPAQAKRLAALPGTAALLDGLDDKGKQELLRLIVAQFVEAYNLRQDSELAEHVDRLCAAMIASPPALPPKLDALLDAGQKETAAIVGVAHALSEVMDAHWASRHEFFEEQRQFFTDLVRDLSGRTSRGLSGVGAQFAVAGSFASRLHERHLRMEVDGLEPIRRILIKLQCVRGGNRALVMNAVRDDIRDAVQDTKRLRVVEVAEGEKRSLLIYWNRKVSIGELTYAPLVMKVRVAEQKGPQLPVLSSIDAVPVLDLRYLVADYLEKTSKIDERGARQVLASATAAVSEMLSRFDIESDDHE